MYKYEKKPDTKQATYSKATALGVNIKMVSESKNRDADSASRPTSDPPYYYVRDFYTLSDTVYASKNLTFLCKLCPSEKLAIIKKKNEHELNYELVQNLNGEL